MRWRPYAQLVRLPNLPSAFADVGMAALATGLAVPRWPVLLLLGAASACLYTAGMAFNDFFDREQDRRERPERPIPSGAVSAREAAAVASGLMAAGMALAALAGVALARIDPQFPPSLPPVLAGLLAGAVLLYDSWLKRTAVGPVAMGTCRLLNVLLGFSLAGSLGAGWPLAPHLAAAVGLYIVGVTWLARTEARATRRGAVASAAAVIFLAFALALAVPAYRPPDSASPAFVPLLVALGFFLGFPVHAAVHEPTPPRVQAAVRRCLMGLILFDAALASAAAGTAGLLILVLMAPSVYLNRRRWLYAT